MPECGRVPVQRVAELPSARGTRLRERRGYRRRGDGLLPPCVRVEHAARAWTGSGRLVLTRIGLRARAASRGHAIGAVEQVGQGYVRRLIPMIRVVFMCGPAGSGKSTVARRMEADGFVRLSFDQEAWGRGIRHMPLTDDAHREIEIELRRRLVDLVEDGREVVLDFSFWSRAMREEWRHVLEPFGVVPETIYLSTDRETCLRRVASRSRSHSDDFALDTATAARYFDHFEPPTPDEGPVTVLVV